MFLPLPLPGGEALMAVLDRPVPPAARSAEAPAAPPAATASTGWTADRPLGLVLVVHGLGGGSEGRGPRRLAWTLRQLGFATLRLNLRGAGPGRPLARGSYCGRCDSDLLPALAAARRLAGELGRHAGRRDPLPLLAAGLSLGGTVLLNACLADQQAGGEPLAGLVCVSSPLDLAACTAAIERPRNAPYQAWLLARLCAQVRADPFGLAAAEAARLTGPQRPRGIRGFDAVITAPRWGYACVDEYYASASPLPRLLAAPSLPPTLLLQARDDPWVPVAAIASLAASLERRDRTGSGKGPAWGTAEGRAESTATGMGIDCGSGGMTQPEPLLQLQITASGGHNGFHGRDDRRSALPGSWADQRCALWLRSRLPA